MAMRNEPCGWVPDFTGCSSGPCCPDIDAQTPEAIAAKALATKLASNILWALTGRRFGCCEITVRPCKPETCKPLSLADVIFWDSARGAGPGFGNNMGVLSYFPTLVGGEVFNIACGCPIGCCKCKADCEILLPGPICEIVEVAVDGIPLAASDYTEYNHDRLVIYNIRQQLTQVSRFVTSPNGIQHDPSEKWCFDATPTSTLNTLPAGPGCFVSDGSSNMVFLMPSLHNYTATYTQTNGPGETIAITAGGVLPTDVYELAPAGVLNAGDSATSAERPDGSTMKVTIISGSATVTPTGRMFLDQDVSFMVEFFSHAPGCPPCQDYNKPLGETGTWGVKYTIGEPVPGELLWAAGQFACELAKAMLGDKSCTLPTRVQNVARQGIDIVFFDPTAFANAGLTGIPLVDLIIRELNPYQMAQASYVWSPDLPKIRRET